MSNPINPFSVTKASDFSIEQIDNLWVDLASEHGATELGKPTSPMPMLVLGGKGSGKTHLMRYFSYEAQEIRHKRNLLKGIQGDRYIGVYLKCESLDASRFVSEGRFTSPLSKLFGYYIELSLSFLLVGTFKRLMETIASTKIESVVAKDFIGLFDTQPGGKIGNLAEVISYIDQLRREVDLAVNNFGIKNTLNVPIRFTRGKLLFGLPDMFSKYLTPINKVQVQYLIDELELLSLDQQKHINTFLRERRPHCSFKIGSRLYGIKTYETFNDNEINKEGSEFEILFLDSIFRRSTSYKSFCRHLTARRIIKSDEDNALNLSENILVERLQSFFDHKRPSRLGKEDCQFVIDRFKDGERPYFKTLASKLAAGIKAGRCPGIRHEADIPKLIEYLRNPQLPLIEKANIMALYKAWNEGDDLSAAAETIAQQSRDFISSSLKKGPYNELVSHFKGDLIAQLRKECSLPQQYLGLETFVIMSSGLPRNLLNILKHIYKWSIFNGDIPFLENRSMKADSQIKGVREASEWFFEDARAKGPDGAEVQQCIKRLATMFRNLRYSDKPSECSLCTFSACLDNVSVKARKNIDLAEQYSLLIKINKGQRDRNSGGVNFKYQLNPMLAPLWDLPVSRRGAIALSDEEINSIFDQQTSGSFEKIMSKRITRMMAPTFGKKSGSKAQTEPDLFQ